MTPPTQFHLMRDDLVLWLTTCTRMESVHYHVPSRCVFLRLTPHEHRSRKIGVVQAFPLQQHKHATGKMESRSNGSAPISQHQNDRIFWSSEEL